MADLRKSIGPKASDANVALLANWIRFKLADPDPYGDGAWGWTELAEQTCDGYTLSLLSDLLYGYPVPSYSRKRVKSSGFGFDPDTGYVIED